MLAPQLTTEGFEECRRRGWTELTAISNLNSKNCKGNFSRTIPKALREEDWNAYLVIKNHRNRYKYIGFNVEDVAGCLHLTTLPEFIWSGYVLFDGSWYAVSYKDLIAKRIPDKRKIVPAEIEYEDL